MKKYVITALLGVALGAASCEKTIDFKGEGPTPKMVVDVIAGPNRGMTIPAYYPIKFEPNTYLVGVEEAVFLFGDRKPEPVVNPALKVMLNGAEIPVETETDVFTDAIYRHFHTPLKEGDRLEFEGETALHGKVMASDIVPSAADITDLATEWFTVPGDEHSYLRTLVTVADRADEKNYYRFAVRNTVYYRYTHITYPYNPETGEYVPTQVVDEGEYNEDLEVLTDHEILFKRTDNNPSSSEQWSVISDEMINGRKYTFDLYVELTPPYLSSYYEIIGHTVTVDVHTLSEATFKHLRSKDIYLGSDNLSDPVRLYSNISGGYGIVSTYNVTSKTVNLD